MLLVVHPYTSLLCFFKIYNCCFFHACKKKNNLLIILLFELICNFLLPQNKTHSAEQMTIADIPTSFWFGVVLSFFTYIFCSCISHYFSSTLYPALTDETFKNKSEKIIFHTYLPSAVHAVAQTLNMWFPALVSTAHYSNRVMHFDAELFVDNGVFIGYGPTFWSGIFVGYLVTDLLVVIKYEKPLMILHHIFASVTWTVAVSNRSLQWYMCFLQLNELSTIFLSSRHIVVTGRGWNKTSTKVAVLNFVTFMTFTAIRVLPLPFVLYNYWSTDMHVLRKHAGDVSFYLIWSTLIFHAVMQTFWFSLFVRHAFLKKNKNKAE